MNIQRRISLIVSVIIIGSGYFSYSIDRYAFSFLVPNISKSLSIPIAISGLFGTIFLWGQLIASVPAGLYLRNHGFKNCLTIGLGVTTLGIILTGLASSLDIVLAARILTGVGEAFWNVAIVLALAELFRSRRGLGVGISQHFFGVGLFAGPLLSGIILSSTGDWRQVFLAFGLIGGVCFFFLIGGVKRIDIDKADENRNRPRSSVESSLIRLLGSRRTYVPIAIFALFQVAFWSYTVSISTYLQRQLAFSTSVAGFLAGADGLSFIVLSWLAGLYSDKRGRRAALLTGGFAEGVIGTLAYSFRLEFASFLFLTLLFGFFTVMNYITIFAYIDESFDAQEKSLVAGLTFTIGFLPAGYVGFVMFDAQAVLGWASAAVTLIGIPCVLIGIIGVLCIRPNGKETRYPNKMPTSE